MLTALQRIILKNVGSMRTYNASSIKSFGSTNLSATVYDKS